MVDVGRGILRRFSKLKNIVDNLFDGTENLAENPDPLLDVVQQYPDEAAWFLKVVMFFGSASGILISIPCGAFLAMYWTPCGYCNRPLRCWVLFHCVLQLLQTPVRLVLFLRLCQIQRLNGNIQECVRQFTHSSAWRTSKIVSIITYGWFILGVVWILNSASCHTCPGLYRLCVAVIVMALARLFVTLLVFYRCFPPRFEAVHVPTKPRGARRDVIDALPLLDYVPEHFNDSSGSSCAVCLIEFEWGDTLRRLPCGHCFHWPCIDEWLQIKKLCPLCLQDVEVQNATARKVKDV